jgi:hypothetical protein
MEEFVEIMMRNVIPVSDIIHEKQVKFRFFVLLVSCQEIIM